MAEKLINPTYFPRIKPELIQAAADTVRQVGVGVKFEMWDVNAAWQGLQGVYQSPEAPAVYALLQPAVADADDLNNRLRAAALALDAFADKLPGIKAKFDALAEEAAAFRASVINGVTRENPEFYTYAHSTSLEPPPHYITVPWDQDQGSIEKNKDLLHQANLVASELTKAEAECANAINAQREFSAAPEAVAAEAAELDALDALPWGAPKEYEPTSCLESVSLAVDNFVKESFLGAAALYFGYNPETGEFFDGKTYGQAWSNLANLVGSVLVVATPVFTVASDVAETIDPDNAYSKWVKDREEVVSEAIEETILVDFDAENPDQAWEDDPAYAATTALLNIGSIFLPGPKTGNISKVAHVVDTAADVARDATKMMDPGALTASIAALDSLTFGGGAPIHLLDDALPDGHAPLDVPGTDAPATTSTGVRAPSSFAGRSGVLPDANVDDQYVLDVGDFQRRDDDPAPGAAGPEPDREIVEAKYPPGVVDYMFDDRGRTVPVDASGNQLTSTTGKPVLVGRGGYLYEQANGHPVPYDEYPAEVLPPSREVDDRAGLAPETIYTTSDEYITSAGTPYSDASATHSDARASTNGTFIDLNATRGAASDLWSGMGHTLALNRLFAVEGVARDRRLVRG